MSERENSSRQPIGALLEELTAFCRSDSLSEDGVREIIERHGAAPNNNNWTPNNNDPFNYFFIAACSNEGVTEGILRYLLEYFPNAARYSHADDQYDGELALHCIYQNKNITLGMVQLLIDAFPDSLRHEDINGVMPLHELCLNDNLNEEVKVGVLKLLLEKYPGAVRHAAYGGVLPIHFASMTQSPEFCRILIEEYPGSEQMIGNNGIFPFHYACQWNTVATAKYLYQLYPESIHVANNKGYYPIHYAIIDRRKYLEDRIKVIALLLECDPDVVLHKFRGKLPIYWVCKYATNENTPKLNAYLQVLQILYDAYPEAIEINEVTSNVGRFCQEVQTFINTQLTYARQARDHTIMTTPDENGQLPLHRAFYDNATITLGSIKLLVKGNPCAICTFDNRGTIPLHVACQHHESPAVVEYLIGLNEVTLTTADGEGNTALHYACRGANHEIIALLLDKYGSISVSKRNTHKQLPIDLLFASEAVSDKESVEYTESIYRLMKAYPETINYGLV